MAKKTRSERKALCHPNRKHLARGYCASCYEMHGPKNTKKATCHPDRPHYARGMCSLCYDRERSRKRQATPGQKEKQRLWSRQKLLREYGLTLEDFDRLYEEQRGLCAICHRPPRDGKALCVDHCHETGAVRQLLCNPCNEALGLLEENIEYIKNALLYIEKYSTRPDTMKLANKLTNDLTEMVN